MRAFGLTAGATGDGAVSRTSGAAHRRTMALLDIVVCHTPALRFLVDLLVRRVGVFGDDVPGVDETGEEAQTAEGDVDERVGRAEAALDPYCKLLAIHSFKSMSSWLVHAALVAAQVVWRRGTRSSLTSEGREENGQEAQEDITAAHDVCCVFV